MGTKARQIVELDVDELLVELNRAYADEWLAAYAYNYMSQVVTGRPAARHLAELLQDTSKDELEHQEELAERIVSLGGKPLADIGMLIAASNDGYPAPPENEKDFDAIVCTVIKAEHDAIETYNRLARMTHGKDPVTYNLILHILTEELEHEDEFESLIS
jgi:bacterioferritin